MLSTREQDHAELRGMLAGGAGRPAVEVEGRDFDALALVRLAMQSRQAQLVRMLDAGEISNDRFLEMSSESAEASFGTVRAVLGEDRFRDLFVDGNGGMLPERRRAFLESGSWGARPKVRDAGSGLRHEG